MLCTPQACVHEYHVLKFLGILFAMTQYKFSDRRSLWNTTGGKLADAPAFGGRFGMSRNRFEIIMSTWSWAPEAEDKGEWAAIDPLVRAFNRARLAVVCPGTFICVDESMSAWRGKDGNFCSDGMPHVTKIERKPKGVGAEFRDAADADTGVSERNHLR